MREIFLNVFDEKLLTELKVDSSTDPSFHSGQGSEHVLAFWTMRTNISEV